MPLKLMCIFAHPDDESLGTGATLAKYAAEGVENYLVCATRGERGWKGAKEDYPGPQALGEVREGELRAAAKVLGIRQVCFLDYLDAELDSVDTAEAVAKIARFIGEIRPDVVITFAPDGGYGHPDRGSPLTRNGRSSASRPSIGRSAWSTAAGSWKRTSSRA